MALNGVQSRGGRPTLASTRGHSMSASRDVDDKLTPLQRKKFDHLFRVLYDTTNDKTLSRADFLELLKKVQKLRRWETGSRECALAAQSIGRAWTALLKGTYRYRKKDLQMHIRQSEWRQYWGDWVLAAREAGGWPATSLDGLIDYTWQREYTVFMFQLMDTSGDGSIDKEEYSKCFAMFGLTPEQCSRAYDKFAKDEDGSALEEVTLDRFEDLWFQYLLSDDLDQHPGNFLMGKVDFEDPPEDKP